MQEISSDELFVLRYALGVEFEIVQVADMPFRDVGLGVFYDIEDDVRAFVIERPSVVGQFVVLMTKELQLLRYCSIQGLYRKLPRKAFYYYFMDIDCDWGLGHSGSWCNVIVEVDRFLKEEASCSDKRSTPWLDVYFQGRQLVDYRSRFIMMARNDPTTGEVAGKDTDVPWETDPPEEISTAVFEDGEVVGGTYWGRVFMGKFSSSTE
jgi:hypothetical protein